MARLITLLEQHLDRQPPTVVTQATAWWETVLALVKLQEIGLGVCLPVKVCMLVNPFPPSDAVRHHDHTLACGWYYATSHISTSFKGYFLT